MFQNNGEKMYKVYDTCGQFLAAFPNYRAAMEYRICMGRYDWTIKPPITEDNHRPSTERQQKAVKWCEMVLSVISGQDFKFEGDIHSFRDCSLFLSKHLEGCKSFMMDLECEFRADRGY